MAGILMSGVLRLANNIAYALILYIFELVPIFHVRVLAVLLVTH